MEFVCLVCGSKNTLYMKYIGSHVDYIACHDCGHQTTVKEYRKYLAEKEIKNEQ